MDEEVNSESNVPKEKLVRCMDWLQKQNEQEQKKISLQNKNVNDIQFILETNAERRNFLISSADDEATVPVGVDEIPIEPKAVPLHKLRVENLRLECEWQSCRFVTKNYEAYQAHVKEHIADLHILDSDDKTEYVCMWDVCGHKISDYQEMVRHIHYHAYHAKLMAIGFNGRSTLDLAPCNKDSSKRNHLPLLPNSFCCMWFGCEEKFASIQLFFDHVRLHVTNAEKLMCTWAGCGLKFPRRTLLYRHARTHTAERVIACYHCGTHFASNRKLCDHMRRQCAPELRAFPCGMCGASFATAYLQREHARLHVSVHACSLCHMTAPSPCSLATHMLYRHLSGDADHVRAHACPHCPYRAITKWDLRKHIPIHDRKRKPKTKEGDNSDPDISDEENSVCVAKKKKEKRKYICHICPENSKKIFSAGARLTKHLVKAHGAQWPYGHSRFRYQISDDGMYRLTTTRLESLEVYQKLVDVAGCSQDLIDTNFQFNVTQTSNATADTPKRFEIALKTDNPKEFADKNQVEITMCDVDEHGNIVNSEVIKSEVSLV